LVSVEELVLNRSQEAVYENVQAGFLLRLSRHTRHDWLVRVHAAAGQPIDPLWIESLGME
jgi:hypothetical protein